MMDDRSDSLRDITPVDFKPFPVFLPGFTVLVVLGFDEMAAYWPERLPAAKWDPYFAVCGFEELRRSSSATLASTERKRRAQWPIITVHLIIHDAHINDLSKSRPLAELIIIKPKPETELVSFTVLELESLGDGTTLYRER
jgi:hypothetical protein